MVSTASLVLGVAEAHGTHESVLIACIAALEEERNELAEDFHSEHRELSAIYVHRGLVFRLQTKLRLNSWSMMFWVHMHVMS